MIAVERSVVQFGRTRIEYAIRRSDRRGTVAISVDPKDGVVLTAPPTAAVARLDTLVHAKAPWIVQRLRKHTDLDGWISEREFVSGETFLYLGRNYRLRIEPEAPEVGPLVRTGGWLYVKVPRGLDIRHRAAFVRASLIDWYRRLARERIPEMTATWASRLGVTVPQVLVRDQRRRWGSCDSKGVVRINWRIIQAPRTCIEYVIAHELVHLLHANHTNVFWSALGRVMPDYDRRRDVLRDIGRRLEW